MTNEEKMLKLEKVLADMVGREESRWERSFTAFDKIYYQSRMEAFRDVHQIVVGLLWD